MQEAISATFMRGGTSKAVIFRAEDLPEDRAQWDRIFLAAMGSPDPNGRQLNGMGGGVSSLSKVCIVAPPSRPDADVDYTFAQILVDRPKVDYSANCGNMSSAIGPFSVDDGLVPLRRVGDDAEVRIHNTNTGKIIVSRFPLEGDQAAVDGDFAIDGVSGTGARVKLDFLDPGGAGTGSLLPSGHALDVLDVPGIGEIEVSMVDASNACVFLDAASIGLTGLELPDELEARPEVLAELEAIRLSASVAMGIADSIEAAKSILSSPKVAIVTRPTEAPTLSGRVTPAHGSDIIVRMISMGRPHRATPLTGALCLAVACRLPGSIPSRMLDVPAEADEIRVGHPSGVLSVAADVRGDSLGPVVESATVFRTARRLFEGRILVPRSALARAEVAASR